MTIATTKHMMLRTPITMATLELNAIRKSIATGTTKLMTFRTATALTMATIATTATPKVSAIRKSIATATKLMTIRRAAATTMTTTATKLMKSEPQQQLELQKQELNI